MNEERFKLAGKMLGEIIEEKDKKYGSSFKKAADFLKIAYPDGVPVDQYKHMQIITRIFDKIMRIATNKDPEGETPFADIGGYALLAVTSNDHEWGRLIEEHTKIVYERDEARRERRKIGDVGISSSTAHISKEQLERLQVQFPEESGIRDLRLEACEACIGDEDKSLNMLEEIRKAEEKQQAIYEEEE
jgi:hypothetical protein